MGRRPSDLASRPPDLGSRMTTLITPNEEISDNMKIFKSLKESDWLIKFPSKTIENEAKEKKEDLSECY